MQIQCLLAIHPEPWLQCALLSKIKYFIHKKLNSEYHEFSKQGHFGGDYCKQTFPELMIVIKKKIK